MTADALTTQLDAVFAAARDRIRRQGEESARANEAAHKRFAIFARIRDKLHELAAPRLQQLHDRFPDGKLEQEHSPHGGLVTLQLHPAECLMTLSFRLSHDGAVTSALIDYDLEVVPVFVQFDPHDRLEIRLESLAEPDQDQIGKWMDDRIVAFAKTFLAVQFTRQYEGDNIVTDPVANINFPKVLANSTVEYKGRTWYFTSPETRQAFEKTPVAYLDRLNTSDKQK